MASQALDDLSGANIYNILCYDDKEEEDMHVSHEEDNVSHEQEEDMDLSAEDNDFLGFLPEDIELSRSKAHKFSYFCNEWMADFNMDTLLTGRNYSNLQFSLQSQGDYTNDTNVIQEFKLYPKYVEELPLTFTLIQNVNQKGFNQIFDSKGYI